MPIKLLFLPFAGRLEFVLTRGASTPPSGGCKVKLITGDTLLLTTGDDLLLTNCVSTDSRMLLITGDGLQLMTGGSLLLTR